MRKKMGPIWLITAMACIVGFYTAVPATAEEPTEWIVTSTGKTGILEASASTAKLTDPETKETFKCESSAFGGTIKEGEHLKAEAIDEISKFSATGCSGPFGITATIKPLKLPWTFLPKILLGGGTAVDGILTGVDIDVEGTFCKFLFSGTIAGTYHNASKTISFSGGSLAAAIGAKCTPVVEAGNKLEFEAEYGVSNPTGLEVR